MQVDDKRIPFSVPATQPSSAGLLREQVLHHYAQSCKIVRARGPRREAGYQLDRVQFGLEPSDWKPMTTVGRGVREIRIHHAGQFRVIYVAKIDDAVYVLHAFQKKTQKTRKRDIKIARRCLQEIREK